MRLFLILLLCTFSCTTSIPKENLDGLYISKKEYFRGPGRRNDRELISINGNQGVFQSWSSHFWFDYRTFTTKRLRDSIVFDYHSQGVPNDTVLIQGSTITIENPKYLFSKFKQTSVDKVKRIAPSYILDTLGIE